MKELAKVIAIRDGHVTVTSQIKSSCGGCAQVDTCGSGQIAKALPQAKLTLTLPYDHHITEKLLKVGDNVLLALPEKHVLSSASQVYLLPLFGLITFSAIGQMLLTEHILSHELLALGLGVIGGYLGYLAAKFQQKQGKNSKQLMPKIIDVLPAKVK